MTKLRAAAVLLGATTIVIAMSTPTQASTEVFHSSSKSQEVEAFFTTTSGCVETDTIVIASQDIVHIPPGAPSPQTSALVSINQFDNCTQTFIGGQFGDAVIPDSALQIRGNLSVARLSASVTVSDFSTNATSVATLDLTWTATGQAVTTKDHIQQKSANNNFVLKFHGTTQSANATGTVTEGSTTVASGTATHAVLLNTDSFSLNVDRF